MFKNMASKLIVFCWDVTTGLPKTGDAANLTAYRSLDFGTVTVLADTSATEIDSTNAKGYYLFDLAQGETNGDVNLYTCKSSTSNIACVGVPAAVHTIPATGILAPATAGRTLVVDAAGLADANVVKVGPSGSGVAQTARDVGLSVLISSGTGTGQLDFTSGVLKANLAQILGTALTETAGQTAAAFKQFFDVASPSGTMNAITAVTTVTNLTNAPTSGDLTATMKTSVTTAATAATPAAASVSGDVGGKVLGGGAGTITGTGVRAIDGSGNAIAPASTALSTANWTNARAGYLDNINNATLAGASFPTDPADESLVIAAADAIMGRLGAPAGPSVSADVAAIKTEADAIKAKTDHLPSSDIVHTTGKLWVLDGSGNAVAPASATTAIQADTDDIQTRLPAALVSGRMDASVGAMAANTLTASALATDAVTEIQTGLATASQIPAHFTNSTFVSDGVFSTASLANAPSGGGGGGGTVTGYADGMDPATLVLDALTAAHDTAGTVGHAIGAAGGAADPLLNPVPGSYPSGTAGAALGRIGTAAVIVTSPLSADGTRLTIVRGSDYLASDGLAIDWTGSGGNWGVDFAGGATAGVLIGGVAYPAEIHSATGIKVIRWEPTHGLTSALPVGGKALQVYLVTAAGSRVELVTGTAAMSSEILP